MNNLRVKRDPIEYLLIFFIIILLPFENSFLQESFLGIYGASLSVIPVVLLFIFKLINNKIQKEFFYFFLYSIFIFIFSALVFYLLGYNESIVLFQPLKNLILYTTWFYIFFYFKNYKCVEDLKTPIRILFYLIVFLSVISVFFTDFLNGLKLLNYQEDRNQRPRGFSLEASTFGFLLICIFLLYSWIKKKNLLVYISILSLILIGIGTKGGLSLLLISFFICSLVLFKRNILKNIMYIILFFIIYLLVFDLLKNQFISDLENYTSIATRSTLFLLGWLSVVYSPVGMGFSGYYPYFYNNIDNIISIIRGTLQFNLNFYELESYSKIGNFENIGTKSFILDCIITYGIPFIIISFLYIKDIIKFSVINDQYYRLFFLIFLLLALMFYNSSFGMYIGAFSMGLLFNKEFGK